VTPAVESAREALRGTIARYEYVTARDVERPLFWHVEGMRNARNLLRALDAAGDAQAPGDLTPAEERAWWAGHEAGYRAGLEARDHTAALAAREEKPA